MVGDQAHVISLKETARGAILAFKQSSLDFGSIDADSTAQQPAQIWTRQSLSQLRSWVSAAPDDALPRPDSSALERAIAELLESEGRAVAVTGKADPSRGEKLLVFHEIELEPKVIIEGLRAKNLPNLWIPKAEDFIRIEHLPLLGSGKLDLQHLKRLADEIK